jgi:hypothetical protein
MKELQADTHGASISHTGETLFHVINPPILGRLGAKDEQRNSV